MTGEPWLDYQTPTAGAGGSMGDYLAAVPGAETANGLPAGALKGVLAGEATAPGITSSAGAVTPFQILPTTAQGMGVDPDLMAKTPALAAHTSAKYLAQQLKKFGNLKDAYAAYNAGPGGALKWIAAGRPKSGFGGVGSYVDRASNAAGVQVAQADTGTQSDAPWLDYQPPASMSDGTGVAQPTPVQPDLADIYARAQAAKGQRGLVPAQPQSFMGGVGEMATGMENQLLGGMQKTSPIPGRPIGQFNGVTDDSGQAYFDAADGTRTLFDPSKYVMLNQTKGPALVYQRTPQTNESMLPALGRVLGVGALSTAPQITGVGGVANALPPTAGQRTLGAFDASGVTPRSLAAVGGVPSRLVHNALGGFAPSAGAVKTADLGMLNQAGQKVGALADTLGPAASNAEAGAALQRGATAFKGSSNEAQALTDSETMLAPTRATSFAQKTQVLSNRLDTAVAPATVTPLTKTTQLFADMTGKFQNADLAKALVNPVITKWQKIVAAAGGNLSWSDARAFRTEIGGLMGSPETVAGVRPAQLKQLYGAISDDLGAAAQTVSPQASIAWKNFNNYFSAGSDRIKGALSGILKEGTSEEGAFNILNKAATEGGGLENAAKLTAIRRSMPDEEWNNVSAAILRKLGEPVASERDTIAEQAGFSADSFLTRYSKLSPTAKTLLFDGAGRQDMRAALDNLLATASSLKNVQRFANTSRTATVGSTGAYLGWLWLHPTSAIPAGMASWVTAKAITDPGVVRLLTSGIQARTPQQLLPIVAQLRQLGVNAPAPNAP